ncbi:DNA ligase [Sporolactobacillus sp. CPB3-1]|uniref:DNA ligase (ATP) n=1 Tax=Sporolactobacillus mangiferae TaxID=2940498 RepID=A0ABT0M6Q2_9BACL|nr:DNA ligase [Sporolactobacillus mangiferae]MCL1630551.1 DNA ligase [Sporolactobacillus mangiferae]
MKINPLIPFEPIRTEVIPEGSDWIHQVKWDGVRLLTYYDGSETHLFNRRKNERTMIYPELSMIGDMVKAHSMILDGEVVVLDEEGRPSFHEIMKRDQLRDSSRIDLMMRMLPINYMVFDMLYHNGCWINHLPFCERTELLKEELPENEHIHYVPSFEDGPALFHAVELRGMEGIVSKKRDSPYMINGKNRNWRKIKVIRDLIAVVGGAIFKNGTVNALLLGLYEKKRFIYIGRAGTGRLSDEDWQFLTQLASQMAAEKNPFASPVEKVAGIHWMKPIVTVKIAYQEWTNGQALRQPSIQAIVDMDPKQCTMEERNE